MYCALNVVRRRDYVSEIAYDQLNDSGAFFLAATQTAKRMDIYERANVKSNTIFGYERQIWEKKEQKMDDESFSSTVMNGQQLQNGQGTQLLRLRINA